mgnify:CR=1 FL=1
MKITKFKRYKQDKKKYINKVFSYRNIKLQNRNYSRKNFDYTINKLVIFENCIFEQTKFNEAKITQCLFKNCIFKNFEFYKVAFSNVSFENCIFENILFNLSSFNSYIFDKRNTFKHTIFYPSNLLGIDNYIHNNTTEDIQKIIENYKSNIYILQSNTIFKKTRGNNYFTKSIKKELKKITPKEALKLKISKKQRLSENAKRKEKRNQLLRKSYEDSLIGKNRKIDDGIILFFSKKYTLLELDQGFKYASENIKVKFSNLSILLKYIDKRLSLK